ncbi:hypothetical protein A9X05_15965 [Mycobacterium sp. E3298]|uniref:hypothetical protein n=1 Tax=unclassified Mycobacterium TaxID=2642494 RepID=UPI0007FDD636|nr:MULTISPECIES: hypothetical protein [unclassified Mycobacterium]OBG60602.1 hypothetical protein A5703_24590 [Mycobacterium sp. E188]OBG86232.1 hypothetical protein A9X05_15965 [Mycobacterium sp. E3298]OBH35083.1 hypothetical protein A5691_07265 [Mycobacterium sp. E183]
MSENPQAEVDPADFPEEGGPGDTLNASEGTDSDELHNDDGDIVVDPPEDWSEANRFGMTAREEREGESLDARLAEEEPDVSPDMPGAGVPTDGPPGRAHRGQIDGAPEDGESLYEVVDENAAPDITQTTE